MADYKELFDLQLCFARRVAQLSREPWDRILGQYTTIEHHTGLNQTRDGAAAWNELCTALERSPDPATMVFRLFERHNEVSGPWPALASCFSYGYDEDTLSVRIHFHSADRSGHSPLSDARLPVRVAELKTLFTSIRAEHPRVRTVWGFSWMIGLRTFVRLFPPEYGGSAVVDRARYNGMGIWGQFFDHQGRVKPQRAEAFRRKVYAASSLDEVIRAFRYERLRAECAIERCCARYGIL